MSSNNCLGLTRYPSKSIADEKAAMFSATYVGQPRMVSFACGDHWHVDRAENVEQAG